MKKESGSVKKFHPPLTNVEKCMDFRAKNFASEVNSIVLRRPECLYEWLGKEKLSRQQSWDSKHLRNVNKARRRTTFKGAPSTILSSALGSARGSARKMYNSKTV